MARTKFTPGRRVALKARHAEVKVQAARRLIMDKCIQAYNTVVFS